MKLRNAPISILIAATLIAIGAIFNFVIGLVLSLAPQLLQGIEVPTAPNGAPTQLIVIAGVACIAFGFVYDLHTFDNQYPVWIVSNATWCGHNWPKPAGDFTYPLK